MREKIITSISLSDELNIIEENLAKNKLAADYNLDEEKKLQAIADDMSLLVSSDDDLESFLDDLNI